MKKIISFIVFAFSLNFIYGMEENESNANSEDSLEQLSSDRNILRELCDHQPALIEQIMSYLPNEEYKYLCRFFPIVRERIELDLPNFYKKNCY